MGKVRGKEKKERTGNSGQRLGREGEFERDGNSGAGKGGWGV